MFGFFKKDKNKINVYSLNLPDFGWKIVDERNVLVVYTNAERNASVSVNFFDKTPDLPTIKDIDYLKTFYRNLIAASGGGLIEVSNVTIQNIPAVKTIFKVRQDSGVAYVGSITIPFENFSFVVKIQAIEVGMTGMRDAVIADKLLNANEISIGENGFENWFSDPYDDNVTDGVLMNKSEREEYDHDFPEHPLSITRKILNTIIEGATFTDTVLNSPKFNR